jgi:capsular polysaccharide export protein
MATVRARKSFLFLQGPISPFFSRIALRLQALGHEARGINLSLGDWLFWHGPGTLNYRGKLADWPAYVTAKLDEFKVTDLVLLGEQRDYHKVAIEAARARGIRVTVTDFGYLRPDWVTFERDGMSAHSRFPRDPAAIIALAAGVPPVDMTRRYHDSFWTMAFWDMAYHLGNFFFWWVFPHYASHKRENPVLVYIGTGRRLVDSLWKNRLATRKVETLRASGTPFFVFPLQMENDFQLRAYSPYPDMVTPIHEVIASFARHAPEATHLLVKVHPWDPGLRNWGRIVKRAAREQGVAARVHYIDGGSLDAMTEVSQGMVTINSTSGLRALCLRRPVKTLGQAIYDIPGMTCAASLDDFWRAPPPPDETLLRAYLDAMAATIQIRGVFYNQPGLDAAIAEATRRLDEGKINTILDPDPVGQ